jgi:hypothetical protein
VFAEAVGHAADSRDVFDQLIDVAVECVELLQEDQQALHLIAGTDRDIE